MTKKAHKRKHAQLSETVVAEANEPAIENSAKKIKWTNKQRVLVFSTRGINHRDRHLMEDIKTLMPHHKPEPKMERSKTLSVINEMCEMKNCNKALLFEGRKKKDLYMWMANIPNGPTVKFYVENVHTMAELKLTGNCLRGSRPLLSFDPVFKEKPHYSLLKELLSQIFGVPKHHPKSQPFFDHVYTFSIVDSRIWFRNFQILSEDGALAEVGPRFVLNPVKIFSGSFGGVALWDNANYVSPAKYRRQLLLSAKKRLYINRKEQKLHAAANKPETSYKLNPLDDLFKGDSLPQSDVLNGTDDQTQVDNINRNTKQEKTSNKTKNKKVISKKVRTNKSKKLKQQKK